MSEYVAYEYHQEVFAVEIIFNESHPTSNLHEYMPRLNELGSQGWEMVSVVHQIQQIHNFEQPVYTAYFKRPYITIIENSNE